jgi:hypothetical protein
VLKAIHEQKMPNCRDGYHLGHFLYPEGNRIDRALLSLLSPDFEPQSFNPAAAPTKPTRFAPIHDSSGKPVPNLYGGSSLEGAIFLRPSSTTYQSMRQTSS